MRVLPLVLGLLVVSIAVPAGAQQPAPVPPAPEPEGEDILDEIDTPEERAARDLERMGQDWTRENAARRLRRASTAADDPQRTYKCDDPEVRELREAVRYYIRAYGELRTVDSLIDELALMEASKNLGDLGADKAQMMDQWWRRWRQATPIFTWALYRLRDIKACDIPPPPRTTGALPAPPQRTGGLSKGTKIGIAAGGGAVLIGGVLAASGGSAAPAAPSQPSAPQPAQPNPPAAPSALPPVGAFSVHLVCIRDAGQNDSSVRGAEVSRLEVGAAAASLGVRMATINFSGNAPWVGVGGTWDPANGRFSAVGRGRVAGIANVRCNFEGTLSAEGVLEGEMVMGSDGALSGGQPVVYRVEGRKN